MQTLLRIAIAFFTSTSDADAEALHRFAPNDVTVEAAYQHVWAARVAAATYGNNPDMVLAIGWHESRFTDGNVTSEVGGRVSCGAMSPYPTKTCTRKTLLQQYLDGSEHLATWLHAGNVRSKREALLGYAGGYYLIRNCRQGPVLRNKTSGDDLCLTPEVFGAIRARIVATQRQVPAS